MTIMYLQMFAMYNFHPAQQRVINNDYAHSKYSISTISINNKALYLHRRQTSTVIILYLQTLIFVCIHNLPMVCLMHVHLVTNGVVLCGRLSRWKYTFAP